MITLPISEEERQGIFNQFLHATRHGAFKTEVLQDYYELDACPSLDAWLAGEHKKSLELMLADGPNEWQLAYGQLQVKKTRVHVVERPYSPYIEWEIEGYKRVLAQATGEDIRLVDQDELGQRWLPDGDFWIFDDDRVIQYHYEGTHTVSADVYDTGDDISKFLELRESLIAKSKPLR